MLTKFTKYLIRSSLGIPLNNTLGFNNCIIMLVILNFTPEASWVAQLPQSHQPHLSQLNPHHLTLNLPQVFGAFYLVFVDFDLLEQYSQLIAHLQGQPTHHYLQPHSYYSKNNLIPKFCWSIFWVASAVNLSGSCSISMFLLKVLGRSG